MRPHPPHLLCSELFTHTPNTTMHLCLPRPVPRSLSYSLDLYPFILTALILPATSSHCIPASPILPISDSIPYPLTYLSLHAKQTPTLPLLCHVRLPSHTTNLPVFLRAPKVVAGITRLGFLHSRSDAGSLWWGDGIYIREGCALEKGLT